MQSARVFMPRQILSSTVLTVMCLSAAGCLVEATLDSKGGGTMLVQMRMADETKFAATRAQMESAHVTMDKATIGEDKWARFELKFADATKLSTTKFFETTAVTIVDGDSGTKALTVKIKNKLPSKLPPKLLEYYGKEARIVIHLPGEIVKTNATAHKGDTATWTFPMNDFLGRPETVLEATYKIAGSAASASAPPTAAPPTGAAPAGK